MSKTKTQQEVEKDPLPEVSKATGVGGLLREGRERKEISLERITQVTRLRPHILRAIEEEDWENLPPPVFVRGFIRSYALALDVDVEKALQLYGEVAPVESLSIKPLMEYRTRSKARLLLIILFVAAAGAMINPWSGPLWERGEAPLLKTEVQAPVREMKEEERERVPMQSGVPATSQGAVLTPRRLESLKDSQGLPQETMEAGPRSYSEERPGSSESSAPPGHEKEKWQVLQGTVRHKTWIRIYVDGMAPKEYLFQPGARHEWKAKEGFVMLIGNAAGIDFELNGKKIENTGKMGQVVRLTFPEGYQSVPARD